MSPTPPPGQFTARELVNSLMADGMSKREIATALGRSTRMVDKVTRGQTSGQLYQPALQQLHDTGRLTAPPPRRRNAAGRFVTIRARGGGQTAPPTPPRPRTAAFNSTVTHYPGKDRMHQYANIPRRGRGRALADAQIYSDLQAAARGQARGTRRMTFVATYSTGRTIEIGRGGYRASDVLSRSRAEGQSPLGWLSGERAGQYDDLEDPGAVISALTVNVTGYDEMPDKNRPLR